MPLVPCSRSAARNSIHAGTILAPDATGVEVDGVVDLCLRIRQFPLEGSL